MQLTERHIKRRIERLKAQLATYDADRTKHTVHGGWSIGYIEGQLSILEDLLDEITVDNPVST